MKFQLIIKDNGVQKAIQKLQEKIEDMTPVMRVISETMLDAIQENFETEGARLPGGKWEEWSEATKEARERRRRKNPSNAKGTY